MTDLTSSLIFQYSFLLLLGLGIWLALTYIRRGKKTTKLMSYDPEQEPDLNLVEEDNPDYAAKGIAFEKYIVHKFDKRFYNILEWRSDKYTDGRYAEANLNPDLLLELRGKLVTFAVECKYRSTIHGNILTWCKPHQFEHYRHYATEKNVPVFVVIGIGGSAFQPTEMFVIPLHEMKSNFISVANLQVYKFRTSQDFYFNHTTLALLESYTKRQEVMT